MQIMIEILGCTMDAVSRAGALDPSHLHPHGGSAATGVFRQAPGEAGLMC